MFDIAAQRQVNRGHRDGFSRAIELVVTPLLFGLVGRAVDGWLDTRPWFMIALGLLGVTGIFVKLWIGYDREMAVEQAKVPARRGIVVTPAPVDDAPGIVVPHAAGGSDVRRQGGT